MASGLSVTAGAPGGGGLIPYPAPNYDVWDFDESAVAAWNSDVTAGTAAGLASAIQTAMADAGTPGAPKYHRIEWTGGPVGGNMNLGFSQPQPVKHSVYILVEPSTYYTAFAGELKLGAGISDVKFKGFQFEPTSTNFTNGLARCVRLNSAGGGRRVSFRDCRFGKHWSGGAVGTYPEAFGGSTNKGWELCVKDCDGRGLFQFIDSFSGYMHVENCFVTGLVDDFIAMTVRDNQPHKCYLYSARNIVMDFADDPKYSGFHCDFVQTGTPADTNADTYEIQCYGCILIGDTWRAYPVQAGLLQRGGGGAAAFPSDWQDNILLSTGPRGIWTPDNNLTMRRVLLGWPPLGGAVPTSSTGWAGGPYRQWVSSTPGGMTGGTPDFQVVWAGKSSDTAGGGPWTPPNPDVIADPRANLGSANAYDQRFPNMTGLWWDGATLRIPQYLGARDRNSVRSWISIIYMPRNGALTGWTENGFNDPNDF